MRTIVWYRGKDLRVADHAPLVDAAAAGEVVPLFVIDPYFFAPERARALPHRMQYLLDALDELAARLAALGSRLVVVAGRSVELVPALAARWRADRVVAHRWTEPLGRERDRRVGEALGGRLVLYEGETLLPPGTLRSGAGTPYAVFTQFARAFRLRAAPAAPLAAPAALPSLPPDVQRDVARDVDGVGGPIPSLADLGLARNPALQLAGERAAHARLEAFLERAADAYHVERDRMDRPGTSRLSADLKFGTLSVATVWRAIAARVASPAAARAYQDELVWREFSHSTLWDRPALLAEPFRPGYAGFPWRDDDAGWDAWARGATGYPVVDAAARQLLAEGFVHNRARMIAASFLTKHLVIDYRRGEAHYLRWLTDGDWAQNNAGWQWSAGCGVDAAPYFRIFNPVVQGQRFDPEGDYVRRWVPELARLPARHIHAPWQAPAEVLRAAGVRLGADYPAPIVEHRLARERYLALAHGHLRGRGGARDASAPR